MSRRFVATTKAALDELMSRDLSELTAAALMVDGVVFAEQCCVVALAICADGTRSSSRCSFRYGGGRSLTEAG